MKHRKIDIQVESIQASTGCCGTSIVEEAQPSDDVCCDKKASKEVNSINTGCC